MFDKEHSHKLTKWEKVKSS